MTRAATATRSKELTREVHKAVVKRVACRSVTLTHVIGKRFEALLPLSRSCAVIALALLATSSHCRIIVDERAITKVFLVDSFPYCMSYGEA